MKTRLQLPLFTVLLTLFCFGVSSDGRGQVIPPLGYDLLVDYPFTGNSPVPVDVIAGLTSSNFSVSSVNLTYGYFQAATWTGSGVPYAQSTGGWNQLTQAQGKFFTFTLQTESALAFDIDAISFLYRSTGAGPETITITINDVEVDVITGANTNSTDQFYFEFGFIYEDLKDITSAEVKIIGWNGGTGDFRVDDVQLFGSVEVGTNPILLANPNTISNIEYTDGNGPSTAETFEVSGSNLVPSDGNVSLTAPSNFEVSLDNSIFSSSILLPYTGGTLSGTEIFVRLVAGLDAGAYSGSIDISGGDASALVSLEGTVIEPFGLPYTNPLRTQGDFDEAVVDGFDMSEVVWGGTGGGGYTQIPNSSAFVSPAINFEDNNLLIVSFDLASFGSGSGRELTVFVSDNNGVDYTALDTFPADQGSSPYITFTQYIDVSALNVNQGRIKFEMTGGTGAIRFRDLNLGVYEGYFYDNAAWVPNNPAGLSTIDDDLLVLSGDALLTENTTANNITIQPGATLTIEKVLSANGNIENNGSIVFKSTSVINTAQLDTFTGTITGNGAVTVERFIPARRAFRFISSAVTTTGNINTNWQEGATNAADNPNPGFGTHITGSTTGENGFDATPSGNPSLFTLDNSAQAWEAVENTDVNTITAGTPYRLLVRGDRSIDVTSNSAEPTNTRLLTTGTLHTGTFVANDLSAVENDFNFFGNPYPASVDMNLVLGASNNVNPAFFYIWDPTLSGDNGRGAYVTIDLSDGSNPSGSTGNQYLQPGQAAFVTTLAAGPASLTFEEAHKNVAADLTTVFSIATKMDIRLYRAAAFAAGETPSDGLRLKFGEDQTNAITSMDAPKFYNQDENLASSNDNRLWSIESRALPLAGESIPLFINQYRTTDYVFEAELTELTGVTAVLRDYFTGTDTELLNNETSLYAFNVDPADANSIADDRFEIVFEELLSTNDSSFGSGFVLFPNPAKDQFSIATKGIIGDKVTVSITNVLGQTLYNTAQTVDTNGQLSIDATILTQGVYTVKLTHSNGGQFTTKFIKN